MRVLAIVAALITAISAQAEVGPQFSQVVPLVPTVDNSAGDPLTSGIGSGAFHPPNSWLHGLVYTCTDRGPNGDFMGGKQYPLPAFAPSIYTVFLGADSFHVLGRLPLRDRWFRPLNGLPNPLTPPKQSESAFDAAGNPLAPSLSGVDTEALVRVNDGTFWPRNQRTIRFLAVDARSGRPTAEYAYEMDPWQNYTGAASQGDMKISELVMIDRHRLLVEERTDVSIKLFVVDLRRPATNILGSTWDDEATLPSLEQVNLAANGIVPLTKTKVFDQKAEGASLPGKIEGIAQIIPGVFALINDNDFNIAGTAETTVTYLYLPPTSTH